TGASGAPMGFDWPHRSRRVGVLGLTFGKGLVGSALPLALAFAVHGQEIADLFTEIPDRTDRIIGGEVNVVRAGGNQQRELAAAVEFSDQGFAVEKKRVGHRVGLS